MLSVHLLCQSVGLKSMSPSAMVNTTNQDEENEEDHYDNNHHHTNGERNDIRWSCMEEDYIASMRHMQRRSEAVMVASMHEMHTQLHTRT